MQKKDFIILDLRVFNSGWEDQLYKLGESLCLSNYKGKVIFIIDKTTHESSIKSQFSDTYYINGTNKKTNKKSIINNIIWKWFNKNTKI